MVERTRISNINNQNDYSSKNKNIKEEIDKKYGQRDLRQTEEIYEEKQYYYPLEEIKRRQQAYQREKAGQNIPHHVQQIAVYETD